MRRIPRLAYLSLAMLAASCGERGGAISVSGFAVATVAGSHPSEISAALDGWIEYRSPGGTTFNCSSTAHQVILKTL